MAARQNSACDCGHCSDLVLNMDMSASPLAMPWNSAELDMCCLLMQLSPSCMYTAAVWRCSQLNRAVLAEISNVLSKLCIDWRSLFDLLCVGLLCNVSIWPCTQAAIFWLNWNSTYSNGTSELCKWLLCRHITSLTSIKYSSEEAVLKKAKETRALGGSDCLHPCVAGTLLAYGVAISVNMILIMDL